MLLEHIKYSAAFLAGLFSFFSPCILPLVPAYFTFIAGVSMDDLNRPSTTGTHRKIILSTLAFVIGFSVIFIALGATAAYFSVLLRGAEVYIRIAGGVMIILLGLHLMGVVRFHALEAEKRIHLNRKPVHFFGAVLIGMAFGAGWSPCIGPLLGSILILAGNQDTVAQGVRLLTLFSAGMALPFMILSVAVHFLIGFVRRATRTIRWINMGAGILLVATGVLLVTDKLRLLSYFTF